MLLTKTQRREAASLLRREAASWVRCTYSGGGVVLLFLAIWAYYAYSWLGGVWPRLLEDFQGPSADWALTTALGGVSLWIWASCRHHFASQLTYVREVMKLESMERRLFRTDLSKWIETSPTAVRLITYPVWSPRPTPLDPEIRRSYLPRIYQAAGKEYGISPFNGSDHLMAKVSLALMLLIGVGVWLAYCLQVPGSTIEASVHAVFAAITLMLLGAAVALVLSLHAQSRDYAVLMAAAARLASDRNLTAGQEATFNAHSGPPSPSPQRKHSAPP
jgi:hypothetical protein